MQHRNTFDVCILLRTPSGLFLITDRPTFTNQLSVPSPPTCLLRIPLAPLRPVSFCNVQPIYLARQFVISFMLSRLASGIPLMLYAKTWLKATRKFKAPNASAGFADTSRLTVECRSNAKHPANGPGGQDKRIFFYTDEFSHPDKRFKHI
jgi:hypothetical protein